MNSKEILGLEIDTPLWMTRKAIRVNLHGRNNRRQGEFKGLTQKHGLIRVLRAGVKQPESYHPSFWSKTPLPEDIPSDN